MNTVQNQLLAEGKTVSISKLCRWLGLPRSSAYYHPKIAKEHRPVDQQVASKIHQIIEKEPACGVRGVWSRLRYRDGMLINRKKVHRIMRIKGWTLNRRKAGKRPRAKGLRSQTERVNQRWATDIALVQCGIDGWCSFVPVVDCCSRECVGWALETTAKAKTAERALEEALLARFGWLRGAPKGMRLRHDNGLVFGSKLYRGLVMDYGLTQEFTTPYTPEQNGLCERFIKTFKEELCWIRNFSSLAEAKLAIAAWIKTYNYERPHQALNYLTPNQKHQEQCKTAA